MPDPLNTPMMRQYLDIKKEYPGTILLFRMGDFYETFLEDAEKLSAILGITLTSRQKDSKGEGGIPLAGFPYHALDGYMTKLLKAGCRVAVCEQTEDPSTARGLVSRDVVEIVTPGTLVSGSALDEDRNLLLGAVCVTGGRAGLVFCNLATGDIRATELEPGLVGTELGRVLPRELLLPDGLETAIPDGSETTVIEQWKFDPVSGRREIEHRFGKASPEGFGIAGYPAVMAAAGALLGYVGHTKRAGVSHLEFTGMYRQSDYLVIDRTSARSLGVTESVPGEEEAILARRTDATLTSGGARLWREWLLSPPMDRKEITSRHLAVEHLLVSGDHHRLRELLRGTTDLERQGGKLGTGRASPRDLRAIQRTASVLPELALILGRASWGMLHSLASVDPLTDVAERIDETLSDDPPARTQDGGFIRKGFSAELDQLRQIKTGGRELMEEMLESEREATGIRRMTLGFNRVFGYYFEVSRSYADMVPEHYTRKQTLVGGERYITPGLKQLEEKIQNADAEIMSLELEIFLKLLEFTSGEVARVKASGRCLAAVDLLCSLALIAGERGWVKPEVVEEPCLRITEGRHPVLEDMLPAGECVPNCLDLSPVRRILLVTGPNMAGKSTYLRQAALLLILAQSGSFVPAAAMEFSPVDRIFTRIGSADRLSRGQSTFLVEMAEAAELLNGSTGRSLAVLDEIGRGTSTYDGLSIAWAMLEHLHDNPDHRPLVLFATHYHELTPLAARLPLCDNANVAVRESGRGISFLYRVEPGAADRSYGIHVASMAGVPSTVVKRAMRVLQDLEAGRHLLPRGGASRDGQLSLPLANPEHPVLDEIASVEPDSLTPRRALELIYLLKEKLGI